jgi:2-polyprenyl-3-methyl-5-hydroxy-6-metoxy-1,4-benzoquinol methylase
MPSDDDGRLGERDVAEIANDVFLQSALETTIIRGVTLELFLTNLRSALLRLAAADITAPDELGDNVTSLFCAMAQQCFLNEYVYAQSGEETRQAGVLRDLLLQKLSAGTEIPAALLGAVAAYFPLHSLPGAETLRAARWPSCAADLVGQQVREPLLEAEDRRSLAALTSIDDEVSVRVMQQYEENPYPRWSVNPLAAVAGDSRGRIETAGRSAGRPGEEILIAGCGTGEHPFDIAQKSPQARILAIDLSRASLAYALRKTREHGLSNVEYAQADILKLGTLGRRFDRIEAMGVLHHLSDPLAGWRVLISLLPPDGVMRVGLYSQSARRSIVEARALIAAGGYRATAEDIRAFRQVLIRARDEPRWQTILASVDFYSLSGCRDMLFNVIEHRFTIPLIAAFLREEGLSFLGFELDAKIMERFREQYSGTDSLYNLDHWHNFESANPQTFRNMYQFSIRKNRGAAI